MFKSQGLAVAEEAIKRIAALYGIEKEVRGMSPEDRASIRQEKAKPLFDELEAWLGTQLPKFSGKSELAKAIRYTLTRMKKMRPWRRIATRYDRRADIFMAAITIAAIVIWWI